MSIRVFASAEPGHLFTSLVPYDGAAFYVDGAACGSEAIGAAALRQRYCGRGVDDVHVRHMGKCAWLVTFKYAPVGEVRGPSPIQEYMRHGRALPWRRSATTAFENAALWYVPRSGDGMLEINGPETAPEAIEWARSYARPLVLEFIQALPIAFKYRWKVTFTFRSETYTEARARLLLEEVFGIPDPIQAARDNRAAMAHWPQVDLKVNSVNLADAIGQMGKRAAEHHDKILRDAFFNPALGEPHKPRKKFAVESSAGVGG